MLKRFFLASFFIAISLVTLLFSRVGEAQRASGKTPDKPIFGQAVAFAVSDAARDLPNAHGLVTDEEAKGGEGREKNELNAREIKAVQAGMSKLAKLDAALQGAKLIQSAAPSAPSLTFDGLADADNDTLIGGRVAPSDENVDVGPNDLVQTINDGFRVWDKNGNPKIAAKLISSLFAKMGGICANTDNGDPVILYDRMADRWFITQFAFLDSQAPPFHQCVAVSQNGDPSGAYFTYDFITPGANFPDYGKFGVWPDAYYMTVNQFMEPGDNFNGVGMYALDRQKMLVGDPTAGFIYFDLDLPSHPEGVNSTLPSDQDGLEAPPVGAPNVFANLISDEFEGPPFNMDALRIFYFHADFQTPANSTFIEQASIPVAAYDPRSAPGRSDVKEPPPAVGADSLDSIEYHLMNRLQYRNRGGIETLVAATTVNVSGVDPSTSRTNYQAGVRYFQLQKGSPGAPYALYDNATFSPDAGNPATGLNRWLPSAAIDHEGNMAVSYSTSSTTVFPSIAYAGRDFNALGGLTGEQTLFTGAGSQLGSANRWGDYQSMSVDPTDDCTFWTTNQYYSTSGQFDWRTRIGRFKFATCQAPAQGKLSGTVTACNSGVPISQAVVQLSNGFSSTTMADGTYSVVVAPGTYTVTVSDGNRHCNSAGPFTVAITDGNTTSLNTCLGGIANPIVDPSDPTLEVISGGNGNGVIDENECNNLNVTVNNFGCAPATSVSAVLSTSTAGVTITQPNSPYPNMAIDASGTNSVPFKISTAPGFACGTKIDFTLTVNFNGGSQVSQFSLPTCTESQPNVVVSGSIDPSDPKTPSFRLGRTGVVSSCGIAKACPGPLTAGPKSYDQYSFVNGPIAACVTVTLNTPSNGANILGSTYLTSFDPANLCTNYLGDPGGSASGPVSWQVDVAGNATLIVVVMETASGQPSTPYSVTVSGLASPPVDGGGVCKVTPSLSTTASGGTPAGATISDTAHLSGSLSATGTITFQLFGPNNATCGGTPIFTSTKPVSGNGDYVSDPFTTSSSSPGTYRWIASYSGDVSNQAVNGTCNAANESVVVGPPATSVTGNGNIELEEGTGHFDLNVFPGKKGQPTGNLDYSDSELGFTMSSTKITGLTINGNHATITGIGKIGKRMKVNFTINVTDVPSPGVDTFSISLSNGYFASGDLENGNITIH
jgi:hypothetical protein